MQLSRISSIKKHAVWAIVLLNAGLTVWKAVYTLRRLPFVMSAKATVQSQDASTYSYIGDDYPLYYPTGPLDKVAMTLHTSSHFTLNASSPISNEEWALLARTPAGLGRTRLGPEFRMFVITIYHQMHCLRKMQVALLDREDPISTHHHVLHCLNYLRQLFLCEAAESLEEGDFLQKDWTVDRIGDTLVCQDWERVYDVLDENYERWLKWREDWN